MNSLSIKEISSQREGETFAIFNKTGCVIKVRKNFMENLKIIQTIRMHTNLPIAQNFEILRMIF